MREKQRLRLEADWQDRATAAMPSHEAAAEFALAGPVDPTLFLDQVGTVSVLAADGGQQTGSVTREGFEAWYLNALGDSPGSSALAEQMSDVMRPGDALVAELTGGVAMRWYSHYADGVPDHTWAATTAWDLDLIIRTATVVDIRSTTEVLATAAEWLTAVPDGLADHQSCLVALPASVRCHKAMGRVRQREHVVEIGQHDAAGDLYWTTGACDVPGPALAELDVTKAHVFGAPGGPSGFFSWARPDGVLAGHDFLSQWTSEVIEAQRSVQIDEGFSDPESALRQLRGEIPRLQVFCENAAEEGLAVIPLSRIPGPPSDLAHVEFAS